MALPIVLLIVLFLTLVFYGTLKIMKIKNKLPFGKAYAPVLDEDTRYDSFILDAILLDESCTNKILGVNETFLYALLENKEKERLMECMDSYLKKYNDKDGALRIIHFTLSYPNKEVLFSYKGKGDTLLSERYFVNIYTPEKVTLMVEVGYGK